jgi:hypothetical protein
MAGFGKQGERMCPQASEHQQDDISQGYEQRNLQNP